MGSGNPNLSARAVGRRRGEIAGQLARFVLIGVASALASWCSACRRISSRCEGERDWPDEPIDLRYLHKILWISKWLWR